MVIDGPVNLSVAPGHDVVIVCQVIGAPTPTVEWLINGSVPRYNRRVDIEIFETIPLAIYSITNIRPEDQADLTCLSKNIAGETRVTAKIEVQG